MNPKRRGVYLSPDWHRFVKRKPRPRKNPSYARNPGKSSMMTWVLLGGAAFLFLTPSGRALASRFTGGATALPGGVPTGSVRLADGTWRTPTGQILGTPVGTSGYLAPLASLVPGITSMLTGWLRGLSDTSSATTIGTAPILDGGGVTMGTPDILSGPYEWNVGEPLPPIPDLTLSSPSSSDFWSDIDTSGWWGNLGPVDPYAGPVPVMELDLTPLPDWQPIDYGFTGLGRVKAKYRFRQPSSFR
jgi:hypothetical protein